MQADTDTRYTEEPLLRFLDSYVLDAINILDAGTRSELEALAPTLCQILGTRPGTWQHAVKETLSLPDVTEEGIRKLWISYSAEAQKESRDPDPIAFAHFVSDTLLGNYSDS